MKILILNEGGEHTLGWAYRRAFESIGYPTEFIDPTNFLRLNTLWRNKLTRRLFERKIIDASSRELLPLILKVNADLIWVGKGDWATPWLWRAIREKSPSTLLVCYNPDDPITTFSRGGNRPWVSESIPLFDVYCTYKKSISERLVRYGAKKILVLAFAWDPLTHPTQPTPEGFQYDLNFIGNGDAYRTYWLSQIAGHPALKHARVVVAGHWRDKNKLSLSNISWREETIGKNMAHIVANSKVSLNILRRQNEGSHNMRTFEIPGCGGTMASQWSEDQASYFPDNVAAIYYSDPNQAAIKISELINDTDRIKLMRVQALDIVKRHTYANRAKIMLDAVTISKSDKPLKNPRVNDDDF